MKRLVWLILTLAIAATSLVAAEPQQRLRVLYVGNSKQERANEFEKLLRTHFTEVTIANREDFDPATAKNADVVVFDWSQRDSKLDSTKLPFGRLEDWHKPTVLVNHAGLLVAENWHLIGRAG